MEKYSKTIENQTFGEERALYGIKDSLVKDCQFAGEEDGESCLKETSNLLIENCKFMLRYPLWHNVNSTIKNCYMADTCRAPLWYNDNLLISSLECVGVKALRESNKITLSKCTFDSIEFGWKCQELNIYNLKLASTYPFFMSSNMHIEKLDMVGKYSFQYVENVYIQDSVLDTKDAFWHSKNVTVRNSVVKGEYLGWYSENLTLINCKIIGTQPLCYAKNLKIIDCEMEACDLSFENSTVDVKVNGNIDSIKNPIGKIVADSIGEVIIDEYTRGECEIVTKK